MCVSADMHVCVLVYMNLFGIHEFVCMCVCVWGGGGCKGMVGCRFGGCFSYYQHVY